ncbi:DNA-methyltransferase [Pseudomonas fulva]|uniref:DNA-methyltransferase n=1 Tax=Pseudomonas fulva TaxID=47880 RepID=UPI0018AA8858|nr:site-specific DNA-methyltransferase [Pseudomonas fulva]MBF8679894.1 site-specific DNA-methyltransferase [Pseudomonas fulva]MBF8717631.1 site-specific DNA-methyltransferase [Pseudomonas fulva]MBF8784697.1 site-specific DNA-methyltransferase [Pseudomonas fulva]
MTYTLHLGDCIEAMRAMPDNSVDSIVTDPPYGLRFMGKRWDYDVPGVDTWVECLRLLKPGGHLLAFAGTRTQHRMAVRIEDAGFEIRDMIAWVYGSGFPKSHNLDGDWQGWGTALKPALEPITVARKPLAGTVAANVLVHGTGALNIDACRVTPTGESRDRSEEESQDKRYANSGSTNFAAKPGVRGGDPLGRWPANLVHDGSDLVLASFPDAAGQQGDLKGHSKDRTSKGIFGDMKAARDAFARGDSGSAARFFYCAKASRADRNDGLHSDGQPAVAAHATMQEREQADWPRRNGNHHPTVKPTDLMAYLCRLVTPAGGIVLDPFMGSGSTGKAAMREGFQFIGCELDPEYLAIAKARIEYEQAKVAAALESAAATESQLSLFGS